MAGSPQCFPAGGASSAFRCQCARDCGPIPVSHPTITAHQGICAFPFTPPHRSGRPRVDHRAKLDPMLLPALRPAGRRLRREILRQAQDDREMAGCRGGLTCLQLPPHRSGRAGLDHRPEADIGAVISSLIATGMSPMERSLDFARDDEKGRDGGERSGCRPSKSRLTA